MRFADLRPESVLKGIGGIVSPKPGNKVAIDEVLEDLRAGKRTKDFLTKYGITLPQFERILAGLIREGKFTKEEYRGWKARKRPDNTGTPPEEMTVGSAEEIMDLDAGMEDIRDLHELPEADPPPESSSPSAPDAQADGPRQLQGKTKNIDTYVLHQPEKDNQWALQLFGIKREKVKGAKFKVNLHGQKYAFVVEELLFRGAVEMTEEGPPPKEDPKTKRERAIAYIAAHGWAAYLEHRAYEVNFRDETGKVKLKARLVILQCKNDTYLAALHTPTPAISFYVSTSLDTIRDRLSKSIDIDGLGI